MPQEPPQITPPPSLPLPWKDGVRFGVFTADPDSKLITRSQIAHTGLVLAATALLSACAEPEEPPQPAPVPNPPSAHPLFLGPLQDKPSSTIPKGRDLPTLAFVEHSPSCPPGGTWREHPLLHDFNGDGRADLVATNREEDGLNVWLAPATRDEAWALRITGLPRDLMYGGSDAGDLDSDGDSDLVYGAHLDGLRVFMNDGRLTWVEPIPQHENPFRMLDVSLGNLNGDEHLDVVGICHFAGPGAGVFLGQGDGSFRRLPESDAVFNDETFGTVVELADLDGDGDDDLFFSCEAGPSVFRTESGPEGLSWIPSSQGLPKTTIGNITRACIPADLDGDGRPELIAGQLMDPSTPAAELRTACIYAWDPEAVRWNPTESGLPTSQSITDAAAADFDGDGHIDILLASIQEGVVIYRGDGALHFTLAGQVAHVANPRVAIGDVNADGLPDVCILHGATKRNPSGGGVQVFLNTPEAW